MTVLKNPEMLEHFPLPIRQNIKYLLADPKFPTLDFSLTGSYLFDGKMVANAFKIKFPYAGNSLTWEILFLPNKFFFAPDFLFHDEMWTAVGDIEIVEEKVPTWGKWDVSNPQCLSKVLQEFLDLYKHHNISILCNENMYLDLCAEYLDLVENYVNIEFIQLDVIKPGVKISIRLDLDVSSVPELQNEGGDELGFNGYSACLMLYYIKTSTSKIALVLSQNLEEFLGLEAKDTLTVPHLDKSEKLGILVSKSQAWVQELIGKKAEQHKWKSDFMSMACIVFAESLVTYDSINFEQIIFTRPTDESIFLLRIELEKNCPEISPKISSKYSGKDGTWNSADFEFESHWGPKDFIQFLIEYIV